MALSLLEGNEAIALGAVAAGCRFFAGYPITPANSVFSNMLKLLPPLGGICLQGEDEIASMGSCLGASMAGLKVMTATSGPGLSLYGEQIAFGIASEVPVVIVDVQRLGPSTGSATRGADGDIQCMRWGGNTGGLPVIVLAPVDVGDCFVLTMEAFNLAEEFRCPVFIAANKEVGLTKESIDLDALKMPAIIDRESPPDGMPYLSYSVSEGRIVPYSVPLGDAVHLVRHCSSNHSPDGQITSDIDLISKNANRLNRKLLDAVDRFSFREAYRQEGAKTLIITYGVTARAAKDVFGELQGEADPVSLLMLKTLWPVPENAIREAAEGYDRIIVLEMNLGQYVREIERVLPNRKIDFFGQMDGRLISPRQIKEVVNHG